MEIWKDVPNYENLYKISNKGNLIRKSFEYYSPLSGTIKIREKKIKPLKNNGYHKCLLIKNGKRKYTGVHRLVADAFIDNPKNKRVVHHKNHNRSDNRVENLEWVTYKENIQYASKAGRMKRTKKSDSWAFKDEDIRYIRKMSGLKTQKELGIEFNVGQAFISKIQRMDAYKYVK